MTVVAIKIVPIYLQKPHEYIFSNVSNIVESEGCKLYEFVLLPQELLLR